MLLRPGLGVRDVRGLQAAGQQGDDLHQRVRLLLHGAHGRRPADHVHDGELRDRVRDHRQLELERRRIGQRLVERREQLVERRQRLVERVVRRLQRVVERRVEQQRLHRQRLGRALGRRQHLRLFDVHRVDQHVLSGPVVPELREVLHRRLQRHLPLTAALRACCDATRNGR